MKNLYWDQQVAVRLNGALSEYVEVMCGVRQACILSRDMFLLYTHRVS